MKTVEIIDYLLKAPHTEIYSWPDSQEIVLNKISLKKGIINMKPFIDILI